ncbi:pilus assembly protein TadG-related protein [Roseinatronobacter sp. S2]|uniref:pilus assembly protein TadG-related protein n=1 Tax=Roseinatronobacter sp. S2 TaxID=3035471 RepID=UPI0024109BBA|nr:pilus assembly protein TadG-related protein [Roseinatronobacter sp. S2]WFE77026.1 pilus assembly protein TadG-related protein [Roseinatronobacter sp. S2]
MAIIVALLLTVLFGFVAFGVDLGQIYRDQNRLQAQADLAAMGAVVDLTNAPARAGTMLERNAATPDALKALRYGRYMLNPDIAPESRFTELPSGNYGVNAVQLDVSNATPLTFAQMFLNQNSIELSATATAMQPSGASFTLGSGLARLEGGVIQQLTGANITLTALDHEALLDGRVTLLAFLDELTTEIGFEAGNYVDLLALQIGLPEILASLARTQTGQAAEFLDQLAVESTPQYVELARIVSVFGQPLGLKSDDFLVRILKETELSALDILAATLDVISASRAIDLDVDVNIEGLLDLDAELLVQERAQNSGWVSVGEPGAKLHTAQTRLRTELELNPNLLGSLGIGVEALSLRLPLYLEVANAEAELTYVNCRPDHPNAVVAAFDTGANPLDGASGPHVAELFLGQFSEERFISGPKLTPADLDYADLLDISLKVLLLPDIKLTLQAKGGAIVGTSDTGTVTFTQKSMDYPQSISSKALLSGAISSLLGNGGLSIRVKPEHESLVGALLEPLLNPVVGLLQTGLLAGVAGIVDAALEVTLDAAGVQVGTADLELVDTTCGAPRLVQ